MDVDIDRVAGQVAFEHALEELLLEQRRVAGVPSVEIRCRCGSVDGFTDYAEHVARMAIIATRQELIEEGVLR